MATTTKTWPTGTGSVTIQYNGQGDGSIVVSSDANTLGSARSMVITVETIDGAITRNLTVQQAACPFPVGQIRNYSYTGSYQEVELPAGQYKLQCWGAQGGSNGANSTYGITAQGGGKGGYSEGVLTLSQKTTVRVYVGGQGSSSAGGFNGGGSTKGTSQYNSGDTFGYSKMGGGGGASDIRLSDGALLSRMIVAGGGSGGAMCYKKVVTSSISYDDIYDENIPKAWDYNHIFRGQYISLNTVAVGDTIKINAILSNTQYRVSDIDFVYFVYRDQNYDWAGDNKVSPNETFVVKNVAGTARYQIIVYMKSGTQLETSAICSASLLKKVETQQINESTEYQVGYVGGGTNGGGYSSSYYGKQNAAGSGGSFGQGANQATTNYRYCSGAGGGGWYGGGGGQRSDSSMTYCKYSGGGSGWVNIAANAGNRPSGYTGLELDSGTTYAGNTSFPSTNGSTETGHSGNGYAKIKRLS